MEKSNEIQNLDNEINLRKTIKYNLPSENYSPEQFKWCPIGKDESGTKCVQVKNEDRCMYGSTFNNQEECENNMKPDFSGYKYNNKSVMRTTSQFATASRLAQTPVWVRQPMAPHSRETATSSANMRGSTSLFEIAKSSAPL